MVLAVKHICDYLQSMYVMVSFYFVCMPFSFAHVCTYVYIYIYIYVNNMADAKIYIYIYIYNYTVYHIAENFDEHYIW